MCVKPVSIIIDRFINYVFSTRYWENIVIDTLSQRVSEAFVVWKKLDFNESYRIYINFN